MKSKPRFQQSIMIFSFWRYYRVKNSIWRGIKGNKSNTFSTHLNNVTLHKKDRLSVIAYIEIACVAAFHRYRFSTYPIQTDFEGYQWCPILPFLTLLYLNGKTLQSSHPLSHGYDSFTELSKSMTESTYSSLNEDSHRYFVLSSIFFDCS